MSLADTAIETIMIYYQLTLSKSISKIKITPEYKTLFLSF